MAGPGSVRLSVPFWSMDIKDMFFDKMKCDCGFAMQGDHAHQHYEFTFGFSRIPVRHSVSGQISQTDTPYILFRSPFILHSLRTLDTQPYKRCQVYFHPGKLKKYKGICDLGSLRSVRACTIPTDEKQMEYLERLLSHMRRLWREGAPERVCAGLLSALLHEISELVPQEMIEPDGIPPYIQQVMLYIVDHMEEELTLEFLAQQFYVGKTKLVEDFRSVTRQSVHEYVTAIRLWRAKTMLAEGMQLSVIADRCGFSRESALITMFRRETGMTPGEWRRSLH